MRPTLLHVRVRVVLRVPRMTFSGQVAVRWHSPPPHIRQSANNSMIKLHNPTREKNSPSEPAMIRRNSGERRPIGSSVSIDRPSPVPAPQAPLPPRRPRRRRSSGASSRSSSSGVRSQQQQHQQALPAPPMRVAFKNETRVRIIHSWRDMSERQWRDTWVTDEDVATMKRDSRKTVKAMRKATLLGTSLAPKYCPRGLEHLASPEELARRCRLREDLTMAVLEEQSLQRREGISRPHALARVSSVLSKWTRDDSHQAAMNDATVAGSIYAGDVENDRRPAAAPAPSALLPCVDDAGATTDAASSSTSTSHSAPASRRRSSSSSGGGSSITKKNKTTTNTPASSKADKTNTSAILKDERRSVQSGDAFSMSKLQRSLDITSTGTARSRTPELGLPTQRPDENQLCR